MRLQIMSDLHMDLRPDYGNGFIAKLPSQRDDVLVLAGDCVSLAPDSEAKTLGFFKHLNEKYDDIVFVPGNHEFWGTSPEAGLQMLAMLEREVDGLHVLRSGKVTAVRGQRFLGDTMWFPFDASNYAYERNMPDFRMIDGLGSWAYSRNSDFRGFLKANAGPGDIVVTHHVPSHKSTPERFKNSQINRFFVSDMADIIKKYRPSIWIHGHTHDRFDYMLGDTRVICNPRGYTGEGSVQKWERQLFISI